MKKRRRIACAILAVGVGLLLISIATIVGATQLENRDSFCTSCHTEPEVTYYERTQAEEASDLASAHASYENSVRCIDCHSSAGVSGRMEAIWQGAQDLVAYIVSDYHDPAITENHLGDAPCLKCHTPPSRDEPITVEDDPNLIFSNSHYHWVEYLNAWQIADSREEGTCSACHQAHSENTLAALGFRYMPEVNATCDTCHTLLSGTTP